MHSDIRHQALALAVTARDGSYERPSETVARAAEYLAFLQGDEAPAATAVDDEIPF